MTSNIPDLINSALAFELSINCMWLLARAEYEEEKQEVHQEVASSGSTNQYTSTSADSADVQTAEATGVRSHLVRSGLLHTLLALGHDASMPVRLRLRCGQLFQEIYYGPHVVPHATVISTQALAASIFMFVLYRLNPL